MNNKLKRDSDKIKKMKLESMREIYLVSCWSNTVKGSFGWKGVKKILFCVGFPC